MSKKIFIAFFLTLALSALGNIAYSKNADALSGNDFNAGRIIDDGVFFNPNTMDAAAVQVFLNSKVPVCETWHAPGYGQNPPFTCLKDYSANTPAQSAEAGLCNQYNGGVKTAAQIIYEVGQVCGINPKVLIVLIQKEQSLITDTWPLDLQYRSATGYGCPDTAACDSTYYGFFNQVYMAARQFKKYSRDSASYRYRAYRYNYVQYHPNTACGGTNVFIQNQATAGLYNYTPYQPNATALSNIYGGQNDGCSSYGNRNFWRFFNDWFGSTTMNCLLPPATENGIYRLYNKGTANHLLTSNPSEVCAATNAGYLYDGQILSSDTDVGGGIPVYRLERYGRYLFTQSVAERDDAVSKHGFRLEGVAFYGVNNSTNPGEARAVHRLVSNIGTYVYTISDFERDRFISIGYGYEGISFYLKENPGIAVTSVYRLSNPSGIYLFTNSPNERDYATQLYGYSYEGVGFSGITQMNQITIPVYRLAGKNGYILTTSLRERLVASSLGYRDEGITMFTYGTSDETGLNKLYRLSRANGNYLYTTSPQERDVAIQNYGFRLEGIGFLTP